MTVGLDMHVLTCLWSRTLTFEHGSRIRSECTDLSVAKDVLSPWPKTSAGVWQLG